MLLLMWRLCEQFLLHQTEMRYLLRTCAQIYSSFYHLRQENSCTEVLNDLKVLIQQIAGDADGTNFSKLEEGDMIAVVWDDEEGAPGTTRFKLLSKTIVKFVLTDCTQLYV